MCLTNMCLIARRFSFNGKSFERIMKTHLNISKAEDEVSGDGIFLCDGNSFRVEIKVSYLEEDSNCGFSQIRPDQGIILHFGNF
jgi:hypothetical protein